MVILVRNKGPSQLDSASHVVMLVRTKGPPQLDSASRVVILVRNEKKAKGLDGPASDVCALVREANLVGHRLCSCFCEGGEGIPVRCHTGGEGFPLYVTREGRDSLWLIQGGGVPPVQLFLQARGGIPFTCYKGGEGFHSLLMLQGRGGIPYGCYKGGG